ncbi:PREDICTED: phosphatidylinositol-glycan biosynthesis class F protein [Cyphomyrmex costatus]|uniref:Phosphatidylinositol-glycan biosynthesis class F protein n=1 Tax=Cyphomyrmex costatus TaxID=456900 RepID=A0A195CNE9_9HYME|nr:PREDICTED: phosphatidylinositol-glycan biosynthesis class F protein [Cyphomyrmex costatus]XP_018396107.1 PREDICTED: phosphatidylinositol-glycan biosynthesis class F protein [Cyphomyrmex costatus]KYN02243.1 Phosphatidylinositol-glycan biosynthesis class F protein [Cyphomyrmex costatus]
MIVNNKTEQRLLLSYCSFTCIYLPGILTLLMFNENLYNVGKYKFLPVLMILTFAEVIKLLFPMLQAESPTIIKIEQRVSLKTKKSWSKILLSVIKFLITAFCLLLSYYMIIILFGAPILSKCEETMTLVITLVTLTYVPTILHLGLDNTLDVLLRHSSVKNSILVNAIKLNIGSTLLGTWLGAIFIPLDWDRPWQAWPIPCVIGALVGYFISHFITLIKMLPTPKLHRKIHQ